MSRTKIRNNALTSSCKRKLCRENGIFTKVRIVDTYMTQFRRRHMWHHVLFRKVSRTWPQIPGFGILIRIWYGTIMCGMTVWDGQLSNHTYRLLFKHGVSPSSATLHECQTNQMPSRSYQLPPENWRRPPGRPHSTWMKTIQQDVKSMNLSVNEAIDMAQNRPLCRLMSTFGATHSEWCMAATNEQIWI